MTYTDADVELVARAMCLSAKASSNYDADLAYRYSKFYWDNTARAVLDALTAAGWERVPEGSVVVRKSDMTDDDFTRPSA